MTASLVPLLMKVPNVRWHIFSKHTRKPYHIGKLSVLPGEQKMSLLRACFRARDLCGAGFETPAEGCISAKAARGADEKQYEQHYNAAALKSIDVPVLK